MVTLHLDQGQACPTSFGEFGAKPEFAQASASPTTLIISPLSGALTSSALPSAVFPQVQVQELSLLVLLSYKAANMWGEGRLTVSECRNWKGSLRSPVL